MKTLGTVIRNHLESSSPVGKYKAMVVCENLLKNKSIKEFLSQPDIDSLNEVMDEWEKWLSEVTKDISP